MSDQMVTVVYELLFDILINEVIKCVHLNQFKINYASYILNNIISVHIAINYGIQVNQLNEVISRYKILELIM